MEENTQFKIKNYLFTPKDLAVLFRKMGWRDIIEIVIFIAIGFALRLFLDFQMESIIFWLFFVSLFYWKVDSRVSIGFALVCLIACPILLILYNKNILLTGEEYAEQVAVWAYYFLVIGVVKQIWEYKMESKKKPVSLENAEKETVARKCENATPARPGRIRGNTMDAIKSHGPFRKNRIINLRKKR